MRAPGEWGNGRGVQTRAAQSQADQWGPMKLFLAASGLAALVLVLQLNLFVNLGCLRFRLCYSFMKHVLLSYEQNSSVPQQVFISWLSLALAT